LPDYSLAQTRAGASTIDLRGIAACSPTTLVNQSEWQTASFGRIVFKMPPDFRFNEMAKGFAHGGAAWISGGREVTVTMGYWSPLSSDVQSRTTCRVEVGGRSVLRMERTEREQVRLLLYAWEMDLFSGLQPLLTAQSRAADDLPLLRAIVSSVTAF
jgi:hypothetical protein